MLGALAGLGVLAGILMTGGIIGYLLRGPGPKAPPKAICGCGHHMCFHRERKKHCYHTLHVRCGCQQYVGPVFLEDVIPEP